jgi:hypothetical protein
MPGYAPLVARAEKREVVAEITDQIIADKREGAPALPLKIAVSASPWALSAACGLVKMQLQLSMLLGRCLAVR